VVTRPAFSVSELRRDDDLSEDSRELAAIIEQSDALLLRAEFPRSTSSQPAH